MREATGDDTSYYTEYSSNIFNSYAVLRSTRGPVKWLLRVIDLVPPICAAILTAVTHKNIRCLSTRGFKVLCNVPYPGRP